MANIDIDRFYYLDAFCLPDIRLYQDGTLFDERKNVQIFPQPISGHIELESRITRNRVRLSYEKLYGAYWIAPWMQDPKIDCRSLAPFGFSHYTVTSSGRVYSDITCNYLVGNFSFDGYLRALLKRDTGEFITIGVHRLVAMAYVPNPDNKPEVNHIDGNKLNNSAANLEWVWGWENVHHALCIGLRKSVLEDSTIHEICRRLERGDMVKHICKELHVPKHSVMGIKSGCHYRISQHYNIPRNRHF